MAAALAAGKKAKQPNRTKGESLWESQIQNKPSATAGSETSRSATRSPSAGSTQRPADKIDLLQQRLASAEERPQARQAPATRIKRERAAAKLPLNAPRKEPAQARQDLVPGRSPA